MDFSFDTVVMVKPEAYETLGKSAIEGYFKAEQRILSSLYNGLIKKGEEQLKEKTSYTSDNIPGESPTRTKLSFYVHF